MTDKKRGMQGNPFGRKAEREAAAASYVPQPEDPEEENEQVGAPPNQEEPASNVASISDSNSVGYPASNVDSNRGEEGQPVAPLPPAKVQVKRTVLYARILDDRKKALETYRKKHDVTLQSVVDQAIDEYLDRRGILPRD